MTQNQRKASKLLSYSPLSSEQLQHMECLGMSLRYEPGNPDYCLPKLSPAELLAAVADDTWADDDFEEHGY